MIRKKSVDNVASIKNINSRFEALKGEYKNPSKFDEKVFWWLISDVGDKIVYENICFLNFNFS